MEDAKRTLGRGFHLLRRLGRIHAEVEFLEFRVHDIGTQDADHEKRHEKKEIQTGKWPSTVEPFGNEMRQSDSRAPLLDDEISVNKNLRGRPCMRSPKKLDHVIRKESRSAGESEKDNCSHPDRGIQNSNKSEKSEHEASLRKTWDVPSLLRGK